MDLCTGFHVGKHFGHCYLHIQATVHLMEVGKVPSEELQTPGEMQTLEELHIRANMD